MRNQLKGSFNTLLFLNMQRHCINVHTFDYVMGKAEIVWSIIRWPYDNPATEQFLEFTKQMSCNQAIVKRKFNKLNFKPGQKCVF